MKRIGSIAVCLLLGAGALCPSRSVAQSSSNDPDIRGIIPFLMLVIDTSGSMEEKTNCACSDPGCTNCVPDCTLVNGSTTDITTGHELKKNRWASTLEALTGTFTDFQCEPLARNTMNGMTYDLGYFMKYNQPWKCATSGTACAYSAATNVVNGKLQNGDGIIDQYSSQVQFGLMTFDGWDTYVGAPPLVPVSNFDVALSQSVSGLWSYGPKDPVSNKQGKSFHYPNCTTDYMLDTGARGPNATEGGLISLNSCSGGTTVLPGSTPTCPSWCPDCSGSQTTLNDAVQVALLKTRPYGGTPIAGALDDLYFHFKSDLTDQFGSCRNRFALLVTDGYPDADYRDYGCDCQQTQDPMQPHYCSDDPNASTPNAFRCPYPTPEKVADDLIHGRSGDKAMIQRLFVVGLAVQDTVVLNRLNAIAHAGCPDAGGCPSDPLVPTSNEAYFANDIPTLVQNLSRVIDGMIEPISRSVPVFSTGGNSSTTTQAQYQINTGFDIATATGMPWTGRIERRRFTCNGSGALVANDIDAISPTSPDLFQNRLNNVQGTRNLKTAAPSGVNLDGALYSGRAGDPCGTAGCSNVNLSAVSYAQFGVLPTDTAKFTTLQDWMYGTSNSVRAGKRLGDIYHSQPAIVSAPHFDTTDEAFNLFRQRPDVSGRPLMLYVGTNDGILHGFSVETFTPTQPASTYYGNYGPGEELWGFVPPLVLNDINPSASANGIVNVHQFTLDGSPVVQNVYFSRQPGQDATGYEYHTVLITGMRGGGNAYIALDVTNPAQPKFLWQFTDPQMGNTFARAAIGQATFMDDSSGTAVVKHGAVAILPGGVGQVGASLVSGDCTNGVTNPSMRDVTTSSAFKSYAEVDPVSSPLSHRSDVRCWKDIGRALYFIDVENGRLIKKIHKDSSGHLVFPSPLVSTPVLFESDIGTLASRAFLTDADGVIWRVDVSAPDQVKTVVNVLDGSHEPTQGWRALPFHDIFWDKGPTSGEVTYEPPLLSVDTESRLVVIVGTGDNNNFVKPTVENRVVSLREVIDPTASSPGTPQSYKAAVSWEKRVGGGANPLVPSELVTGTMALVEGQLFFGTFISITSTNACDVGKGRIFAVDYLKRETNTSGTPTDPNGANPQTFGPRVLSAAELGLDADAQKVINVDATVAPNNFMVMGLGITERPTCTQFDTQDFNVFGQAIPKVTGVNTPSIYLVAQASGDSKTTGSLIQKIGKSKLGSIEIAMKKKTTLSRVTSWATTVD